MINLCGIDYSITSPAMVIWNTEDINNEIKLEDLKFYTITQKELNLKNVEYMILTDLDWCHTFDRYDQISNFFIDIIKKFKMKSVAMEGYSFASNRSLIYNIAENTGLLKYKIFKNNIKYNGYSPKEVKKFATGNGNANKDMMINKFNEKFNINAYEYFNCKKINPISDFVDAFWVLEFNKKLI